MADHFTYRVLSSIKVNGKTSLTDELVVLEESVGDELIESGHVSLESLQAVAADSKPPKAAAKKKAK